MRAPRLERARSPGALRRLLPGCPWLPLRRGVLRRGAAGENAHRRRWVRRPERCHWPEAPSVPTMVPPVAGASPREHARGGLLTARPVRGRLPPNLLGRHRRDALIAPGGCGSAARTQIRWEGSTLTVCRSPRSRGWPIPATRSVQPRRRLPAGALGWGCDEVHADAEGSRSHPRRNPLHPWESSSVGRGANRTVCASGPCRNSTLSVRRATKSGQRYRESVTGAFQCPHPRGLNMHPSPRATARN